ncbi:AMP-binding protein [Streptomyces europaeiscabiei]|uniref:AMP-binding protein n=1 Tax=Streptomyces europaeiscabiei TaxID=146819 RepID=UPI002E17EC8D
MEGTADIALHGRFQRGLARAPRGVAVRCADAAITYEELHELALRQAGALVEAGARSVAVLAEKRPAAYVGILAALYAGAAVVPLRPDFPAARTRRMIEASGVTALIVDEKGAGLAPGLAPGPAEVAVFGPGFAQPSAVLDEPVTVAPGDPACVLFTSGSTGRPKGVTVTHGATAHYFGLLDARYDFTAADVFSQTFDLNFDCAFFDLFNAWGVGATLQTVPPHAYRDLPTFLNARGVTVWFSTPGVIALSRRTSALASNAMPGLRWSLFAGEALQCRDAADWQSAAPNSTLENLYGPTELTVTVAAHRWSQPRSQALAVNGVVPIGAVHAGHEHLLLDEDGQAVEDEGELCVSGPQLSPGYLDPADESGRFVRREGRRWYRTGDRVRRIADGELAYLGRADAQVQVHGWRIELAEIEHALRTDTSVHDAVTVGIPKDGTTELVVFYTAERAIRPVELAARLRETLPETVVPRHFHHVEEFPLNTNRKIDRASLAERARALHTPSALVHGLLDEAVAEVPEASAVRDAVGVWTYREVGEYSHAFAAWLAERGVGAGERIVVQLPTRRPQTAMLYGTSRHGAVFVPVNPTMKPFHLGSVISSAAPQLIIAAEAEPLRELTEIPVYGFEDVWQQVEKLRERGARAEPAVVSPQDVAVLVYTSGSTAEPKGVIEPHAQITFAARAIQAVLGYRGDDVVFCRFPLSWDYGLYKMLLACLGRSEIVLAGEESDLALLRRMREVGATVVPIVPSLAAMLTTLAAREDASAGRAPVRLFTNTGAALPDSTTQALREAFPGTRVVRQFGQTECKRITVMPPDEDGRRPGAVGLPLPGTRVLILDDEGNPLPPGETGEIVAAGPHVMPGYWRAPELTARAFRRDPETGEARLHTGDYGRLDDAGYLYFEGRRDDMFKRKGIRMSTLEIEAAAMDIPGISAAGAIPPDGERDLALCVETDLPSHTVLRELARRLEPAKVPAICHVVDEFPLTAHGKNATAELARLVDGARK